MTRSGCLSWLAAIVLGCVTWVALIAVVVKVAR